MAYLDILSFSRCPRMKNLRKKQKHTHLSLRASYLQWLFRNIRGGFFLFNIKTMRTDDGYFYLYRRDLYHDMLGDSALIALWALLNAMANFKDSTKNLAGSQTSLKEGQLCTSDYELKRFLGQGRNVVRRCLKYLERTKRITLNRDYRGTIITICDYKKKEVVSEQPRTSPGLAPDMSGTLKNKKETKEEKTEKPIPTAYQALVDFWNDNCNTLPQVRELTPGRRDKIRRRLKEKPDPNYWRLCIKKMAGSDFCRAGKWANFDWLIKNRENSQKVFEGNYDNQSGDLMDWDKWVKKHETN
jgi:hypothetical protein